jgi:NitT/TauT family transport system substrate-binding protein
VSRSTGCPPRPRRARWARAIVNIAQIFQHSGLQLACRRDRGTRRRRIFKGKKIGVWFAGNEYPFLAWMAKLGFHTDGPHPDITVLRQGGGVKLLTRSRPIASRR